MTEQVIDIRDRIEKMRNQMTPASDNTIKNKNLAFEKAGQGSVISKIEEKKLTKIPNQPEKKTEIIEEVNFVSNAKNKEDLKKKTQESTLEENIYEHSKKTNQKKTAEDFKKSENFKTYDDYHNENLVDDKKQSVKIDENQSFPQFSLNVSNPISWKLMLLIMLMQLLTNMMLVVVLYLK